MATLSTMEIVTKFVELLTPLTSEERQRIITATLVLLGEKPLAKPQSADETIDGDVNLPPRALLWLKQHQLTMEAIEQVFHLTGTDADVIAHHIPGKNGKEKTLNVYLLTGVAQLLSSGEPTFDDKRARAFCKTVGCYSEANHAAYLKDKGNTINGTKEKGWVLTAPGLKQAATLVKELGAN